MAKYFTLGELCKSDKALELRIANTPTDNASIERMQVLMTECLDKVREL